VKVTCQAGLATRKDAANAGGLHLIFEPRVIVGEQR